jgi:tRNA G18 (ribose-2'-O)-methylase SpoU
MNSNERFDQLEGLMADMLRRMDQLAGRMDQLASSQEQIVASQVRTNELLDGVIEVLKITDQRFQRVEDILVKADERQQRFEEALLKMDERQQRFEDTQRALVNVLQQQTDHLGATFRTLESHNGRIQKLEGNQTYPRRVKQ